MKIKVTVQRHDSGTMWCARLWGKASPILRPVPGNTHPARADEWSSRESAIEELPRLLGCDIEVIDR